MADLDRYGPDTPMSAGGKALLTSFVAHKDCSCAALRQNKVEGPCSRCLALDYIKKHWPWWYFTVIGNMGVSDGV